ncbi:MAG: putative Type IV secretory pathway VirD4 component [Parcubacteria bacterium C7867-001]|nr:MAG: putative Type IV secretory pathway VirD4 component [Parcubacteria bacterium C7867-001]
MAEGIEGPARPIATPEDELAYLREQVAAKERELADLKNERPRHEIVRERLAAHRTQPKEDVMAPGYALSPQESHELAQGLDPEADDETMQELRAIMEEKGVFNALSVLEKLASPHLEDDFHRFLVQYISSGIPVRGFSEGQPEWKALHLTLFEIALPEANPTDDEAQTRRNKSLKELVSAMEQFYSGMLAVEDAYANEPPYFTVELAVPVDRPHLMFYVSVPNGKKDLFQKQVLAIFPNAVITPQPNDYNIFAQDGTAVGSYAHLRDNPALALKDYEDFDYDPLNSILNAFAKINPEGEGAALQIIIRPERTKHTDHYRKVLHALRSGETRSQALSTPESFAGEMAREVGWMIVPKQKNNVSGSGLNESTIKAVEKKIAAPVVLTNIRLVASSADVHHAESVLSELEAAFNAYENTQGNGIRFTRVKGGAAKKHFRNFSFRLFSHEPKMPLSLRELTTMYHFPPKGIESSPHLKQSRFTMAAAPIDSPKEGLLLGTNTFRGATTEIRLAPEDRLRHLYVIGQTGTGKTSYMKTLIDQDIRNGEGVCFIDPHGNDILDVLSAIPPERYEDVIYFDPAHLDRPFGLNLLEYDPRYPEQKTFIVNEILAIFRRLYGDVPESMGPAFEQYFRNATLLVMEDPASGSTLLDISRVLSNSEFRNRKLMKSNNPIVNQFWEEIATKAEGEASLANIVPYITNKFDDFTANDFMRPIIGQQESSFKFREVMDNRKILLVNLSKGRLGERNANLLGLIMVGKLFMAALSRADTPGANFPPFYFYIDEFQNITTDSIPGILSEARKYKLSLTIAHQFLKQIDEKIRDAVFGNVGSMSVFRVGEEDGEFFAKQFAPVFSSLDFVNIENYNAYLRILSRGVPQKPFNIKTLPPVKSNPAQVNDLRELSYLTYGRDREVVEGAIRERYMS